MDIIIKNGLLYDPAANTLKGGDIHIKGGCFSTPGAAYDPESTQVIDAAGCIVSPGLIDAHGHVFPSGSFYGVKADIVCPPNGITTVIDAGSAGLYNMDAFCQSEIAGSVVTIKALLQPSMYGVQPSPYEEIQNPELSKLPFVKELFARHKGTLLGLKIRTGGGLSCGFGTGAISSAKAVKDKFNALGIPCNLTVHFGPIDDDAPLEKILSFLDKGDVFTHTFRGDSTIFDGDNKILDCVLAARERGVLFDTAAARGNLSINCAHTAMEAGFFPDIISTDVVVTSINSARLVSLPFQMSMFLNMGMDLLDVLRAVTYTPAKTYGLLEDAGTICEGRPGDVTILKLMDHDFSFTDNFGRKICGEKMLLPMATIKRGRIIFRSQDLY